MVARWIIALIKWYQRTISANRPPVCRFSPTCSNYAIEAIQKKGLFIGTAKAIWRVLRCNPFGKGGYDPVEKE